MFVSGLCLCIYIYTLIHYKKWHLYVLNWSNKLRTWLIPFHAIWGLFWYVSLLRAWCALLFYNFVEVHVVQALIETISKCQSQEIRQRHLMTAVWIGLSGSTELLFMGASHLPSRNKTTKPSFGKNMSYSYPKQTLPDPDFDWNIVQSASAPYHQGVWAGQVQVPTKIPLVGMGRNTNACHAAFVHWCYSFLRTCL